MDLVGRLFYYPDKIAHFLARPRYIRSQKAKSDPQQVLNNIRRLSQAEQPKAQQLKDEIHKKSLQRIAEIEAEIKTDFGLKSRRAVEYEFSIRDSKNRPIRLKDQKKKAELTKLLKEQIPSLVRVDFRKTRDMVEVNFDTANGDQINSKSLIEDILRFKILLPKLIEKIYGTEVFIDESPLQRNLSGYQITNTGKLHINLSFTDNLGENIFNLLPNFVNGNTAHLLDLQRASLAYSTDKQGLERYKDGRSCTSQISYGKNFATGGTNRILQSGNALFNSGVAFFLFNMSPLVANSSNGIILAHYLMASIMLINCNKTRIGSKANASLSYREMPNTYELIPKRLREILLNNYILKRTPASKEATRVEDRIHGGSVDPALAILNNLGSLSVCLKQSLKAIENNSNDVENSIQIGDRKFQFVETNQGQKKEMPISQKPEDLIAFAADHEADMEAIYGKELLDLLKLQFLENFYSDETEGEGK